MKINRMRGLELSSYGSEKRLVPGSSECDNKSHKCSLLNIIRMNKSRQMRWAGHVAWKGGAEERI
jgi:hypothetical protein